MLAWGKHAHFFLSASGIEASKLAKIQGFVPMMGVKPDTETLEVCGNVSLKDKGCFESLNNLLKSDTEATRSAR